MTLFVLFGRLYIPLWDLRVSLVHECGMMSEAGWPCGKNPDLAAVVHSLAHLVHDQQRHTGRDDTEGYDTHCLAAVVGQDRRILFDDFSFSFTRRKEGRAPGETHKLCFDTTLHYGGLSAVLIHRFYQAR